MLQLADWTNRLRHTRSIRSPFLLPVRRVTPGSPSPPRKTHAPPGPVPLLRHHLRRTSRGFGHAQRSSNDLAGVTLHDRDKRPVGWNDVVTAAHADISAWKPEAWAPSSRTRVWIRLAACRPVSSTCYNQRWGAKGGVRLPSSPHPTSLHHHGPEKPHL